MIRKSLLLIAALSLNTAFIAQPKSIEDITNTVYDSIQKIQANLPERDRKLDRIQAKDSFNEEELTKILDLLVKPHYFQTLEEDDQKTLKRTKLSLQKLLKQYTVSGFSFCFDANGAFFYDPQNPQFDVIFKNGAGDTKVKTFQAQINSIGLKCEFAVKANLVFFLGSNFNYLDSSKTLDLGTGIDFKLGVFAITYAPFTNAPGGILIVGIPLGITLPGALSVVTSGTLTPCK